MTAIIGVLSRKGIAFAADSAATGTETLREIRSTIRLASMLLLFGHI